MGMTAPIDADEVFGPPDSWPHSDLIAFTPSFDPALVLPAYRAGVFPMPLPDSFFGPGVGWWSPLARGIIPPGGLRVTRSLRQACRRYTVTVNRAFDRVLMGCADPQRPGGWIDAATMRAYRRLHEQGTVVSIETWASDGTLAGGLYGVSIGGLFAGESMFHRPDVGRDASKVALVHLVRWLEADGVPRLLDVQWRTSHLGSLGAVEISRRAYLGALGRALPRPAPDWARAAAAPPVVAGTTAPEEETR
ncbi:MAG: leucyl/phenylalanyl-tRNA--protein transferase [Propionibacteriaceae bacterium]|jgi:leucyl/phenylalanyl-tRNA--protein transferase|nr:leucyl/phenylalanyl-tRNA--protein transferase [Propionibacteriaceae bacterium]